MTSTSAKYHIPLTLHNAMRAPLDNKFNESHVQANSPNSTEGKAELDRKQDTNCAVF